VPPTNSYITVQTHNHSRNSHSYYANKIYVVEPVQPNPSDSVLKSVSVLQMEYALRSSCTFSCST